MKDTTILSFHLNSVLEKQIKENRKMSRKRHKPKLRKRPSWSNDHTKCLLGKRTLKRLKNGKMKCPTCGQSYWYRLEDIIKK